MPNSPPIRRNLPHHKPVPHHPHPSPTTRITGHSRADAHLPLPNLPPAAGLSLLPDILVCRRDDIGERHVERLLLAVAIMSRSTRELDTGYRQALYDLSKVPSYWMFDPARRSLTVRELVDGEYAERTVVGDDVFEATVPFSVRVVPAELVSRSGG
ncbi:Uma2 family endonuclease [Kribbella pittospori]|uniref:Uma2 family endonuclease n=1 Tax=Kribbella pittospori TaxID=722689 RepID=A0A4R0KIF4_9ACTN|nr:Uma2 family endonuclease [Kribbella pittospori]